MSFCGHLALRWKVVTDRDYEGKWHEWRNWSKENKQLEATLNLQRPLDALFFSQQIVPSYFRIAPYRTHPSVIGTEIVFLVLVAASNIATEKKGGQHGAWCSDCFDDPAPQRAFWNAWKTWFSTAQFKPRDTGGDVAAWDWKTFRTNSIWREVIKVFSAKRITGRDFSLDSVVVVFVVIVA